MEFISLYDSLLFFQHILMCCLCNVFTYLIIQETFVWEPLRHKIWAAALKQTEIPYLGLLFPEGWVEGPLHLPALAGSSKFVFFTTLYKCSGTYTTTAQHQTPTEIVVDNDHRSDINNEHWYDVSTQSPQHLTHYAEKHSRLCLNIKCCIHEIMLHMFYTKRSNCLLLSSLCSKVQGRGGENC